MTSSLTDEELKLLSMKLRQGDYDGMDIMRSWIAIEELLEIRSWRHNDSLSDLNIDIAK